MRIAIVTPAFNVAPYLAATIRSVLAQSHEDWRMVVVDDGSTDQTPAIARGNQDARLLVVSQTNQGVSAAREAGLRLTEGEAVLFLDGDDRLAPDALCRLAASLRAHPGACAAVGAHARIGLDGRTARPVPPASGDLLVPLLVRNRFINGGHVLIRRAAARAAGAFRTDLAFGEDWEYWVRLALVGPFAALPDPAPVLLALDRPSGAYRRLAADPGAVTRCLDAIHTNPALGARLDPATLGRLRRRADAEACWSLGREMIRHGATAAARPWLLRSVRMAPSARGLARVAASRAAPLLPAAWRGPFRPYGSGEGRGVSCSARAAMVVIQQDATHRGADTSMTKDTERKAQDVVQHLRDRGHHAEADKLAHHLTIRSLERGVLYALRETCNTVLTAIEAIDPVTQTMIEELRLDVDAKLRLSDDDQETK